MNNSTSILDLPTDPVGGGNISNNISLNAKEMPNMNSGQLTNENINLDQSTINLIVNGLQQATLNGATQLPSRDISMSATNHTNDPQIQPNYIPQPTQQQQTDYIQNTDTHNSIIDDYSRKAQYQNSLDNIYNEIQTPLLLAVLYFLFQLPFFKKLLYTYIPFLFLNDGNFNINGYLFNSILFGFIFYLLNKITRHFNAF